MSDAQRANTLAAGQRREATWKIGRPLVAIDGYSRAILVALEIVAKRIIT